MDNAFKAFINSTLSENAIYNIQIAESYDLFLYDILCGFKRDEDALSVYKNSHYFTYLNGEY
jgi:hypothetical protein